MSAVNPTDKGVASEAMVTARLIQVGYRVLKPITVERYDLVVVGSDDLFRRVQVKTGRIREGQVHTHACSVNYDKRTVRGYAGEVDDLAIYVPRTDIVYLVPMTKIGVRTDLVLRVTPPRSIRSDYVEAMLWAKDFLLERVTRIERATFPLATEYSTPELHPQHDAES